MHPDYIGRDGTDLCIPTVKGGLGFRRVQDLVDTFSLKLWWLFRSQQSLGSVFTELCRKDTSDGRFTTKFAWQLVRTGHTIQGYLRRIGSHMASRCQCCSAIETIQHLFIDSCIANQFVRKGHIRTIVPLLILWFIWTARNDAKYQDISMEPETDHLESVSHYLSTTYRPFVSGYSLT
ncbi:Retrotransposon [Abeliophyllum distichum]|uniref:Retrotransposon n=1 Tax=Abeliophyllum distichum TaxID=126358 RepID=A0ABD1TZN0_9LAMI